jgi:hypothetical protein
MYRQLRRTLVYRPFLWILAIALLALISSLFWERQISYDDGRLGTLSFAVLYTFGLPFVIPIQVLSTVLPDYLAWGLGIVAGVAFYTFLDRISMRWITQRSNAIGPDA